MRTAKDLQLDLIEKQKQFVLLSSQINDLRNRLLEICDHADTEEYKWEHDNGYGVQRMLTGKRCIYCLKVDYWNRGVFSFA